MAGRINTNTPAEFGARLLGNNNEETSKVLRRLAAGLRINSAADDAAGFGIGERLTSLTNGLDQASRNLQDSASALQVAEGGLAQISDSLQRVRELSVQAANDTLTDADRAVIQEEVDQLTQEIDRQIQSTSFNGQPLLTGQFSAADPFTTQSGGNEGETISTTLAATSTTTLGINGLDVSTRAGAENALTTLSTAIDRVSTQRADIGASINRIDQANDFVGIARENTLAARSRIQDADFAEEITKKSLLQIRTQTNVAALSQANLSPQNVLSLLK